MPSPLTRLRTFCFLVACLFDAPHYAGWTTRALASLHQKTRPCNSAGMAPVCAAGYPPARGTSSSYSPTKPRTKGPIWRILADLERPGASFQAVAYGGEIASIGFLSIDNPGIDFFQLKRGGATFRNISAGDRVGLEDVARAISMAGIKPVIDRVFGFETAREAFAHLDNASHSARW